jgi:hypothetical protein
MSLEDVILENRSTIINKWFNHIIEGYPADAAQFIRRQSDAFANPIGSSIRDGAEWIVDGLARDAASGRLDEEKMRPLLDRIIRIRALQDYSPSQSLRFIPALKGIIRDVTGRDVRRKGLEKELASVEAMIDELLFLGFDVYSACRDRLGEIKLKDEQRRIHLLLRRAKIICEREGIDLDLPDLREDAT